LYASLLCFVVAGVAHGQSLFRTAAAPLSAACQTPARVTRVRINSLDDPGAMFDAVRTGLRRPNSLWRLDPLSEVQTDSAGPLARSFALAGLLSASLNDTATALGRSEDLGQ